MQTDKVILATIIGLVVAFGAYYIASELYSLVIGFIIGFIGWLIVNKDEKKD